MAHHTTLQERKDGLAATAPERQKLIHELTDYMAASQLSASQLAQMVGKSETTIHKFLQDRYHGISRSDSSIRALLRQFLDANPIAASTSARGTLYETENTATLRHWFYECLNLGEDSGEMACVYGGPGSQKSFVTEHLVAELNRNEVRNGTNRARAFQIYCEQDETPSSLVAQMMLAAGLRSHGNRQKNLASLRFAFRHNRTLWIFDEGQHLSLACLEVVRSLRDRSPYFGVMVLGSHRLREFFTANAAQMEQWHSRITEAISLPGIAKQNLAEIVRQELKGIADFSTEKGKAALESLLAGCLVQDIYSGRSNTRYYSIRNAFMGIAQIRKQVTAQKGVAA